MNPSGRRARWLDSVQSALDAQPTPMQYAALRITRLYLARSIPAYYPAPLALRAAPPAERHAA